MTESERILAAYERWVKAQGDAVLEMIRKGCGAWLFASFAHGYRMKEKWDAEAPRRASQAESNRRSRLKKRQEVPCG